MKVNSIGNNNLAKPAVQYNTAVVPYPELNGSYGTSLRNAEKADPFTSGSFSSIIRKFERAYRLLFTPEVEKTTQDIKEGIDTLFDGQNENKVNLVA